MTLAEKLITKHLNHLERMEKIVSEFDDCTPSGIVCDKIEEECPEATEIIAFFRKYKTAKSILRVIVDTVDVLTIIWGDPKAPKPKGIIFSSGTY